LGIYAFARIGVDLLPNINFPHLIVQTTYPNAAPEEIEKLITEPLESAAGTVTGVKNLTSVSREGISVLSVDFVWGTDMDFAVLSLREKLDNMRFALPREAGRPTIIRVDPSSTPIMTLVLSYKQKVSGRQYQIQNAKQESGNLNYIDYHSSEEDVRRLVDLKEAARVVFKRRLEQIDGVAQAVITGGLEREIRIEADPAKLNMYNLTFEDISRSLQASNINLPAGSIMKGLFRYSLRTIGEYSNTNEIGKTILRHNDNGSTVLLSDCASVKESFKERQGLTRFNGSETIGILINKEPESSTIDIAHSVRTTLDQLNEEYPDFELAVVSDHSQFIDQAISNVKQEILYGGILAFIVLFFFLGSVRNIFIIGVTIPSALILTSLLMYIFKVNFNIVSLGGIALGVGMLLDNAIIVIENVSRLKEGGFNQRQSALRGSAEVAMPIAASTLTTIAVFLPLIFLKGITGELFRDQSYAVAFSLIASIITALTLIPMLASRDKFGLSLKNISGNDLYFEYPKGRKRWKKMLFWIRFPFSLTLKTLYKLAGILYFKTANLFYKLFSGFYRRSNNYLEKIINKYELLLEYSLTHRAMVLAVTGILIILTILAAIDIKKEFIPDAAQDEFVLEVVYPQGTSLKGNSDLTGSIERLIGKLAGVSSVVANIGRVNEFDYLNRDQISVNKTNLLIKLKSADQYYRTKNAISMILGNQKGIKYSFKKVESTFTQVIKPAKNDIVIKIKNKDIDAAFFRGEQLIQQAQEKNIKGITDLRMGIEKGEPEYRITINRDKCNAYGISVSEAAGQILNYSKGYEATFLSDFDTKVGINVRAKGYYNSDINNIISNYITSGHKKIPIRDVIDYQLTENYNEIWREGQSRVVYIYADIAGSSVDKIIPELERLAASLPKQPGEVITIGGANDEIRSSFSVLYAAILISALLMYMVLASEFESFVFPFIIIFSVPLGLIGGILLLYLFGESISIISLMGLVILIGIADNDAVVKVEFILRKRKEGLSVHDAILAAGKDRFRPIVMNSFTVIFGLVPMMIGLGAAVQLRMSLSLAIAGGLLSSTFLTLIIIPVLYTYLEPLSKRR